MRAGVLMVGLTGGIGAGKSTAAAQLARSGAVLLDADQIAREVVASGSDGLAAVAEAFGAEVLDADGTLDRAALARVVFADDSRRRRLNGILHPLIAQRTAERLAELPAGAIAVHDVPLLVENRMGSRYHLVLVVHAPVEERIRRLMAERGMSEQDAWARVEAQADDRARRAAADVWLDNSGAPGLLEAQLDRLWRDRIRPFAEHLGAGLPAPLPEPGHLVDPDPDWPAQALRLLERVTVVAGNGALRVDHVGATAVPGLPGRDVLDLQLVVRDPARSARLPESLAAAGFAPLAGADGTGGYASCDPGRSATLLVRAAADEAWPEPLLVRDWLRAEPAERDAWAAAKRKLAGAGPERYRAGSADWFAAAMPRARDWAAQTGWSGLAAVRY